MTGRERKENVESVLVSITVDDLLLLLVVVVALFEVKLENLVFLNIYIYILFCLHSSRMHLNYG